LDAQRPPVFEFFLRFFRITTLKCGFTDSNIREKIPGTRSGVKGAERWPLASTSILALSPLHQQDQHNITMEHAADAIAAGQATMRGAGLSSQVRNSDEFAHLAFAGLEVVPPGVVLVSQWRPGGGGPHPAPSEVNSYGGVARKP
jgi:S-adenosyl methyltransferase